MEELLRKFKDKTARVAVIGAGYVGLPFAVESATAGFDTVALDLSVEKVNQINEGRSYIGDISDAVLRPLVEAGSLRATTDAVVLGGMDAVIICVPTPLNKTKDPDVSLIMSAADALLPHLHRGPAGGARVDHLSRLYARGPRARTWSARGTRSGKDIFLAFSPERVDPGNQIYQTKNTPKVIGGITAACNELTLALYEQLHRHHRPGLLLRRRGDGQAAREHLPGRQHRAGQRGRPDVQEARSGHLGGDRRRRHQTLRLHALLPRPRPRRPLHPRRSALPLLEAEDVEVHTRGSSNWPGRSTPRCPR